MLPAFVAVHTWKLAVFTTFFVYYKNGRSYLVLQTFYVDNLLASVSF